MIFYTPVDDTGRKHWVRTQLKAAAINKTFDKVDVPVDGANLEVFLNTMQAEIDRLNELALNGVNMGIATGIELAAQPSAETVEALTAPTERFETVGALMADLNDTFDPRLLEQQVELLGEAGTAGFDALETHQSLTKVGHAFSRGVHILNIIAAGEHQLMRLLDARRRTKKFGER